MVSQAIFKQAGKKAVLLCHSFSNNPKVLLPVIKVLHQADYTVYAPVFRGHESGGLDQVLAYQMTDWLVDGEKAYQFLCQQGYQDIHVAGLSMGGLVALDLYRQHPQINSLALFSTPLSMEEADEAIRDYFIMSYQLQWRQRYPQTPYDLSHQTVLERRLDQVLSGMRAFVQACQLTYPILKGSIFLAQGLADTVINPGVADRFVAQLNSKVKLTYQTYPNANHYLTLGAGGRQLAQDWLYFLSQLSDRDHR